VQFPATPVVLSELTVTISVGTGGGSDGAAETGVANTLTKTAAMHPRKAFTTLHRLAAVAEEFVRVLGWAVGASIVVVANCKVSSIGVFPRQKAFCDKPDSGYSFPGRVQGSPWTRSDNIFSAGRELAGEIQLAVQLHFCIVGKNKVGVSTIRPLPYRSDSAKYFFTVFE
jgi:hypothetical protein